MFDVQVTFDCADPHGLAEWWAGALGWVKEPSDERFIQHMIAQGFASEADTTTFRGALVWKGAAAVSRPDGGSPRLHFQLVPEAKTVKNRLHLDLRVGLEDVEEVIARLVESGASVLGRGRQGPHEWVVVADPEGNELCVSQSPPG